MALTISIDGTGVLADADDISDNQGGSWTEDGGGFIYQNEDVYLFAGGTSGTGGSPTCIGSKYASKTGYTTYEDTSTINFSSSGDFVYFFVNIQSNGAFTAMSNDPFNLTVGSAMSASPDVYEYTIAGKGNSNGWTGGWKCFVIDPTITSGVITTGTPDTTAADVFGMYIDTDVSVRAESIFISQIVAMKGITCTGTPTATGGGWGELVTWCTDYANRLVGVLEERGGIIYQKGGVTVGNSSTATTLESSGDVIQCEASEHYNSSNAWVSTYPSDANYLTTTSNASVDWENVTYIGWADNKIQWDTSLGNASSVVGGALRLVGAWSVKSTDTFDGVVFSENDALSLGAASYDDCSFIECALQTITSSVTSFSGNTFKDGTASASLALTSLDDIDACIFISDGSNHAIDMGTVSTSPTYAWNHTLTNYATSDGSTGNEAIRVIINSPNVLTINVAVGATKPSIYQTGTGSVVVNSGVPVSVTTKEGDGTIVGSCRVHLRASDGTGPFPYQEEVTSVSSTGTTATVTHASHGMAVNDKFLLSGITDKVEDNAVHTIVTAAAGSYTYTTTDTGSPDTYTGTILSTFVALDGTSHASTGLISTSREYATDQPIVGWARKSSSAPYYKQGPIAGDVEASGGFTTTAVMVSDE